MIAVAPPIIDEIVRLLVDALHPEQIYLFGSHAYGTPHVHSDLDLLVVVPDGAGDPDEIALTGRRALLQLPVPIDILVYRHSEMDKWAPVRCSLPYTAVTRGKRLYAA